MKHSFRSFVLPITVVFAASGIAYSQPTGQTWIDTSGLFVPQAPASTAQDTTCLTAEEFRELLNAMAIGAAGMDRLDFELRFHSRTMARYRNAVQKAANLDLIIIEEQGKTEQRKNEAEAWKKLYQREKRGRVWGSVWKYGAIGVLGYLLYDAKR